MTPIRRIDRRYDMPPVVTRAIAVCSTCGHRWDDPRARVMGSRHSRGSGHRVEVDETIRLVYGASSLEAAALDVGDGL